MIRLLFIISVILLLWNSVAFAEIQIIDVALSVEAGRADPGTNTLALPVRHNGMTARLSEIVVPFVHELGHAIYNSYHPLA